MKAKFIYVFGDKSRDIFLSKGYEMLKEDKKNKIYVFKSNDELKFDMTGCDFVETDLLTF